MSYPPTGSTGERTRCPGLLTHGNVSDDPLCPRRVLFYFVGRPPLGQESEGAFLREGLASAGPRKAVS